MQHPAHCDCHLHSAIDPVTQARKVRLLWVALLLIGGFASAELVVGIKSQSLALLADSEHMMSNVLALLVALLATWISRLPASDRAPFGYRRVEILAALANGVGLIAISLWIVWEAINHLRMPPETILSLPMLITAAVGVGVNGINALLLHPDSHHDLNLKGAFLHMVADMIGSLGVLLAAIAVNYQHWLWADGAVSLLVSALIIASSLPLIRDSLTILLEQSPPHCDSDEIRDHLTAIDAIVSVDQMRIWSIAPGQTILAASITVSPSQVGLITGLLPQIGEFDTRQDALLNQIRRSLQQTFGISDVIIQMMTAPATTVSGQPLLETISSPQG